ncbi:hypothetical protein A3860_30845 [Niastella vici]|uniref:Outer membrane protein beta-barrel domain-containing protein n=1 Tax=Niastella vici TaxID=1703345 RepID=A0A1V9FUF5_9BACT|nr:hypothetical protein [Niastella vici]OQP61866.1 hypothetical protein A3860_30845 [Niastella vici]
MIRYASILLMVLVLAGRAALGQSEVTFEQYHVVYSAPLSTQPYLYMPVLHYLHPSKWYAEARYNYEDADTYSLYFGRAFTGGKNLNYSFVPLLGASVGKYKSFSTGLNIDMELDKFFFSSQSQYSRSTSVYGGDFVYTWSELGYQSLKWLYAGVAAQHTHVWQEGHELQPGFMLGFTFNRFTVPIYSFEPFNSNGRNFIVGLTMAWKHSKRKQPAFPVVKGDARPANGNTAN